jgi:hypothetical protein
MGRLQRRQRGKPQIFIITLETHHLSGRCVGFPGKFISTLRILRRALRMPVSALVIAFFIVLGGSAMSMGRPFMFLSRSSV